MTRIALGVEYDGSLFHGWQKQVNASSIQETLEAALTEIACEPIQTVCAGRTDTGVHATGQIIHFDTHVIRPNKAWVLGCNALLPESIRVHWAVPVPTDFDARRSALARRYRYTIHNHPIRPSLLRHYLSWYYRALDVEKMREAALCFIGEHDFSAFRASGCQSRSPIRCLYDIKMARVNDQIMIELKANAFLHHMVRNMVGVLLEIGSGEKPVSWARAVLESRDRRLGGITAPATGLCLVEVQYPLKFGLPSMAAAPWFLNSNKELVI